MKTKQWTMILGMLLSIILLIIVFARLDWETFFKTLATFSLPYLLLATVMIIINVLLRSLRWNLIAGVPLTQFKSFWQAASIGYLGNMIYPARAGEALRIVAIHHFVPLALERAVTSAVIDRMLDMIIAGLFVLWVLQLHSQRLHPNFGKGAILIFIIATISLIITVYYAKNWQDKIQQWQPSGKKWQQRLKISIIHGLESVKILRQARHLFALLFITTLVFVCDFYWMWQMTSALGWSLPFTAGMTVSLFIVVGISLPSAPAYVGIFQIACVFALQLYGIAESQAVAYSFILQLLIFTIFGLQGLLVLLIYGFNFMNPPTTTLPESES